MTTKIKTVEDYTKARNEIDTLRAQLGVSSGDHREILQSEISKREAAIQEACGEDGTW